ncbi:AAA family ATPase [Ornithinimicrobium sp. F0845]|uniref:RNA polymerase recycling motor ATPase HelR n=1 Tax=Ornithinimicrobium sp. F0845 TaxID=2926412 RepID=UPI001FF58B0A|nr:RNA polymerase recycling motor ATPase HelR [Ornithinimicrobium sp. F0845]MCK0111923.1 AAA family ATPase [Ornithinimicrobium sp. F0845]
MTDLTTSPFALPDSRAAKADPALIADDERHLAAIAAALEHQIRVTTERLAEQRRAPGSTGQAALDRDLEIHRLTAQLRVLQRYGLDLCLGRVVRADDPEPVYIGRTGLTDSDGDRLLIDWRAPAAEPYFAATHADPMGLVSRRRYRWTRDGQVSDYWDEVFDTRGLPDHVALDDQSAFIASLGSSRSPRMQDVLSTIQADQDAIIRTGSRGALVVDGGPGTGKTVVALHRTAYLLYADPRLGHKRGGVLFVGPHEPYLDYVGDVLPSLGEEGVQTVTLRDLLPEGADALPEPDPVVAQLKSSVDMVQAIEPAVRFSEEPPASPLRFEVDGVDLRLSARDWTEAFAAPEAGTTHNDAREQVWEALVQILLDQVEVGDDEDFSESDLRRALAAHDELTETFNRAWPLLEPDEVVADLWSVPAFLRLAAPWLSTDDVRRLQREDPTAWTVPDLPLLDAARQRVGDPRGAHLRRRRQSAVAVERERLAEVIDRMIEADDGEGLAQQLRHEDLQEALVDDSALPMATRDQLAGPFAHIIVDEAQELTDAEWQMLLVRCPSRSLTIVGDRAQARHGFTESWQERLERIGVDRVEIASLTINYRTPQEVMAEAEPVIKAAIPDANVPTSVRESGLPVRHASAAELDGILQTWLAEHDEGTACVIATTPVEVPARVRCLTPVLAKGLEFDLVILVDPESFGAGVEGAVDRYVAMTRATQQLVILTS